MKSLETKIKSDARFCGFIGIVFVFGLAFSLIMPLAFNIKNIGFEVMGLTAGFGLIFALGIMFYLVDLKKWNKEAKV